MQVILKRTGHQPGKCGTAGAAHIPCQCQHGKHRRAAAFDGSGCFAKRSRPEDSHRKAADRTAEQSHERHGNKNDAQIRRHAQHTAVLHKTVQVQPIAELAVDQSCRSHQQGERHRTGKVAHGFGDAQTLLCKRRCPLAHCLLRCAGTEHHQQKDPKIFRRNNAPRDIPFSPSSWSEYNGTVAKKIVLQTGISTHSKVRIFQFSTPNRAKNAVDSSTTPICPQQ